MSRTILKVTIAACLVAVMIGFTTFQSETVSRLEARGLRRTCFVAKLTATLWSLD